MCCVALPTPNPAPHPTSPTPEPTPPPHGPPPAGSCTDADGYTGYDFHVEGEYYEGHDPNIYSNQAQCVADCDANADCWGFVVITNAPQCVRYLTDPTSETLISSSPMTVYEKCASAGVSSIGTPAPPNIVLIYSPFLPPD